MSKAQLSGSIRPTRKLANLAYRDGNDGPWSTFSVGVGSPLQYMRVLISTLATNPLVVLGDNACQEYASDTDKSDCLTSRGGQFNENSSTTWDRKAMTDLSFERNLGLDEKVLYGLDNVTLGKSNTPAIGRDIVAGIATETLWTGLLGVKPQSTNITDLSSPVTSMMEILKNTGQIPSLAYGYTAGAYSESLNLLSAFGSLTLGGYDESRLSEEDTIIVNMNEDPKRDLVVGLHSVLAENKTELLNSPISILIDSGVSHIWLPTVTCRMFESTFGLVYNETLDLYIVNDTLHTKLQKRNPVVSFSLRKDTLPGDNPEMTVDIPYSAFDLELTKYYPTPSSVKLPDKTRYFPLRRAANETQYTLGRAFLQYAYIIADYERSTFTIGPAEFPSTQDPPVIKAIKPTRPSTSATSALSEGKSPSNGTIRGSDGNDGNNGNVTVNEAPALEDSRTALSAGALAGIIVGAIFGSIIILVAFFLLFRRHRQRDERFRTLHEADGNEISATGGSGGTSRNRNEKFELVNFGKGRKWVKGGELPGDMAVTELHMNDKRIELPADETGRESRGTEKGQEPDTSPKEVHEMP